MTAEPERSTVDDTPADGSDEFVVPVPETDVGDAEDAAWCPYCDRPFRRDRLRDLHVGEVHPDECTDEERAAHEAALEAESDDLWLYHMKIVVALGVLFFAFVFSYMAVVTLL